MNWRAVPRMPSRTPWPWHYPFCPGRNGLHFGQAPGMQLGLPPAGSHASSKGLICCHRQGGGDQCKGLHLLQMNVCPHMQQLRCKDTWLTRHQGGKREAHGVCWGGRVKGQVVVSGTRTEMVGPRESHVQGHGPSLFLRNSYILGREVQGLSARTAIVACVCDPE